LLAGCLVAGAGTAMRTVHLGQAAPKPTTVPHALLVARRAKLDRFQQYLRKARESKPPALPRVPRYAPVVVPPAPPPVEQVPLTPRPPARRPVRYVRPKPVVEYVRPAATTTTTSPWGDDEREGDYRGHGSGGGDD
jgi:hypothetical protein